MYGWCEVFKNHKWTFCKKMVEKHCVSEFYSGTYIHTMYLGKYLKNLVGLKKKERYFKYFPF